MALDDIHRLIVYGYVRQEINCSRYMVFASFL